MADIDITKIERLQKAQVRLQEKIDSLKGLLDKSSELPPEADDEEKILIFTRETEVKVNKLEAELKTVQDQLLKIIGTTQTLPPVIDKKHNGILTKITERFRKNVKTKTTTVDAK